MELMVIIIASTWYILPSYIADMTPTIFHGGGPLDRQKTWKWDGRRILGDGKSVFGSLGGILTGLVIGVFMWFLIDLAFIQEILEDFLTFDLLENDLLEYAIRGFLLGFGTILGDVSGSFIKRRLNFTRGVNAPGLDQLGFLIAALIVTLPFFPVPWEFIALWIPVAGLGQPLFHELGKFLDLKPIGDDPAKNE